jgi:hypothetical protein
MRNELVVAAVLGLAACDGGSSELDGDGIAIQAATCSMQSTTQMTVTGSFDIELRTPGDMFFFMVAIPGEQLGQLPDEDPTFTYECGAWVAADPGGGAPGCMRPQNSPDRASFDVTFTREIDPAVFNGGTRLTVNFNVSNTRSGSVFVNTEPTICAR